MNMTARTGAQTKPKWVKKAKLVAAALAVLLVIILIFQNYNSKPPLALLFWQIQAVPLSLLLVVTFGAGSVAGFIAAHLWNR
jgi:uncharacterized integral membrane protein